MESRIRVIGAHLEDITTELIIIRYNKDNLFLIKLPTMIDIEFYEEQQCSLP